MDFEKWPKMPRLAKVPLFVTEKIDGTNAQIAVVQTGEGLRNKILTGSRNRWITPDSDNAGFAAHIAQYHEELSRLLPPGRHYGEWAGPGIQKNPLRLEEKRFFAFNLGLFTDDYVRAIQQELPWFDVVPLWFQSSLDDPKLGAKLESCRESVRAYTRPYQWGVRSFEGAPEGFVIWMADRYIKWTIHGEKWQGTAPAEAAIDPFNTATKD